jgi:hypothetical protein
MKTKTYFAFRVDWKPPTGRQWRAGQRQRITLRQGALIVHESGQRVTS